MTGDIIKVKGKTYEVWEEGENNLILRSLCDRHYFVTIHKTMMPKYYANTGGNQAWQTTT